MTRLVAAATVLLLTLPPNLSPGRPVAAQEVAPYLPVTIQAVPPIEGIRFVLDGRSMTTDHNGLVFTRLRRPGAHNLTAPELQRVEPGLRVQFAKWSDGEFPSVRKLSVTTFTSLEAGFDVSYATSVDFVSRAGDSFSAEGIDSVTIIDDRDTGYSLAPTDGPQWLPGSRALLVGGDIRIQPISYVADAVIVDGRDRLASGQPRFRPDSERSWRILLEGSPSDRPPSQPSTPVRPGTSNRVIIEVRDAILGIPTGSAVRIEGPDGSSELHELGEGARLSVEEAGAGDFRATALGPGISFAQRFDPSLAKRVRLTVITYLDIAIGLLTLVLFLSGVVALARRIGSPKPQRGSPIGRARPWFRKKRGRPTTTRLVPAPTAPERQPTAPERKPAAAAQPSPVSTPRPAAQPVPSADAGSTSDRPEQATPAAETRARAVELATEAEAALTEARERAREIVAEAENSLTKARKRAREIMERGIEEAHRQTTQLRAQAEAAVAEAREQAVEIIGEAASDARELREMAEREAAELLRHALRRRNEIQEAAGRGAVTRLEEPPTRLEESPLEESVLEGPVEPGAQPRPGVTIKISDVSLLEDQVESAPVRPGSHRG